MHILEALTPFQYLIEVTIDDRTLDYLLTVDELGQVHDAQALVFELPPTPQKLILGTDGQLERKVRAHAHLFKYLLPFVLAGRLPMYQQQFAPLVEEIRQRLKDKGVQNLNLNLIPKRQLSLAVKIQKFYTGVPSSKIQIWDNIEFVLANLNNNPETQLMAILYGSSISGDFFPLIVPFFNLQLQAKFARDITASLAYKVPKAYFLSELKVPSCDPYAFGLLRALEKYGSEDPAIFQAVVQFYETRDIQNMSVPNLVGVLEVLKHYPSPRTKEIVLEVLFLNRATASFHAAKTLLEIGTEEKEIAQLLMPLLNVADPEVSKEAFGIFEHYIPKKYWPDTPETLTIVAHTFAKGELPMSIQQALVRIALKSAGQSLPEQLLELLQHDSSLTKRGVFQFIERMQIFSVVGGMSFRPFVSATMMACYWALAHEEDKEVSKAAIHLLGEIGYRRGKKKLIGSFLTLLDHQSQNPELVLEIMQAINSIMARIYYPKQIEPYYLSALNHADHRIREAALKGFKFSPNRAFKNSLAATYKEDPASSVRTSAQILLK